MTSLFLYNAWGRKLCTIKYITEEYNYNFINYKLVILLLF